MNAGPYKTRVLAHSVRASIPGELGAALRLTPDREAAVDRRSRDTRSRTGCSRFLSAPAERDDYGARVAKDPPHSGQGEEAGEPIDVLKSFEFAYPLIVTSLPARGKWVTP
jgi:hypothetical protein